MTDFIAQHVRDAFAAIQKSGIPEGFGQSTKWDIVDYETGARFPPKAILFLAKQFADDNSSSGGGGDVGTNNALRERGFQVILKDNLEQSDEAQDIEKILKSNESETTKRQLVNARLGQGGFREELLELWGGKCALTKLTVKAVLRASHIKAWKMATNHERLDASNGLLLAASVDALFDRHLISFDDHGQLLVCSTVKRKSLIQIGLHEGRTVKLTEANKSYLRVHRDEFEKHGGKAYRY